MSGSLLTQTAQTLVAPVDVLDAPVTMGVDLQTALDPVSLVTPDPVPLVTGSVSLLGPPSDLLGVGNDPLAPDTLTWVAPVTAPNLSASWAANWSPNGPPVAGDTLNMPTGVMDVAGNDLQGDVLNLGAPQMGAAVTLNLANQAVVSLDTAPMGGTSLVVNVSGPTYVDLNGNQSVDVFNLDTDASVQSVSIDLIQSALAITGGIAFLNTGNVTLESSAANVNSDLEGTGSWLVKSGQSSSSVEFGKSVSFGQNIEVQGNPDRDLASMVKVDDPASFGASVQLDFGKLVLADLKADSYAFQNNVLSLYQNNNVVDSVTLASVSQGPLAVYATNTGVLIDNSGLGGTNGVALPLHG